MSRYIDADMLYVDWYDSFVADDGTEHDNIPFISKGQIDDAPSINIVFCKECKHRIHTPAAPNKNYPCEIHPELNNCGLRKGLKPIIKLDDFCSYGER